MPTAKLNGIDIYYEERGEGFPVVLTHGLGDCAELWSGLADALADLDAFTAGTTERGFIRVARCATWWHAAARTSTDR